MFHLRLATAAGKAPGTLSLEITIGATTTPISMPVPGSTAEFDLNVPAKFDATLGFFLDTARLGLNIKGLADEDLFSVFAVQTADDLRSGHVTYMGTVLHAQATDDCDVKCEQGTLTQDECCVVCKGATITTKVCC
jgi:hypothetical protein